MTTIAILPLAEPGHLNATVQLGRELRRAGHQVRYLGDPTEAALFHDRGLPFAPLTRIDSPSGPTYAWAENDDELALIDSILLRPTIDACNAGKRVVNLSTTYPLGYQAEVPPLTCGLPPARDARARAQVAAAWEAEWRDHRAIKDPHPHVGRAASTLQLLRSFAQERGWADERWDPRAAITPIARLPELVLAPALLDWPQPGTPRRRYGGPCVDLDRLEPELPFARRRAERPLVYCSFGTQTHRYPLADALGVLLRAGRELPDVDLVVATGGVDAPADAPPNVICVRQAPQIALLRRADLMVSHGGLNGLKEALCCGTPALVLPFDCDQPGNAARIAFHGLGAAATWEGMSPAKLAGLIRGLLRDAETTRRVRAIGARLRDEHERPTAATALAELVELAVASPR